MDKFGWSHESPDLSHGEVNSRENSVSSWKSMASVTNFTASEAPWQNGLVERNGRNLESGSQKSNQRRWSTRIRVDAKTRLRGELNKERPHQLVWTLACPMGHRSRIQICLGHFLDEKQRGELASLELTEAARRPSPVTGLGRALVGVRASAHN